MPFRLKSDQARFGTLLRERRRDMRLTLTKLAERCGIDDGNLSRIERGERKPPKMTVLLRVMEALRVRKNTEEWHELLSAAARGRLETLEDPAGIAYLHYENTLHGLSKEPKPTHTFTVTEAAAEIGRIQAVLGIKKIIVQASDGSDLVFPIEDRSHAGGQRK